MYSGVVDAASAYAAQLVAHGTYRVVDSICPGSVGLDYLLEFPGDLLLIAVVVPRSSVLNLLNGLRL